MAMAQKWGAILGPMKLLLVSIHPLFGLDTFERFPTQNVSKSNHQAINH